MTEDLKCAALIARRMASLGATCEEVAQELQERGYSNAQIAKLMNTPINEFLKGKPAPVTLAI